MRCGENLAARPATGEPPPTEAWDTSEPVGTPPAEVPGVGSGATWVEDPPTRELPDTGWRGWPAEPGGSVGPGAADRPAEPSGSAERDPEPRPRWRRLALWAALVVVLAGGGTAFGLSLSGGHGQPARVVDRTSTVPRPATAPGTGTPAGTETSPGTVAPEDGSAQAEDMDTMLRAVKATRAKVPDTLGSCDTVTTDLGPVQRVVQERQGQAAAASDLEVDRLTGGTDLRQALEDMTQRTLEADEAYLSWAEAAQSGDCTDVTENGAIGDANQRAADAKRHFVSLWNAVADQYGLPAYAWNDF